MGRKAGITLKDVVGAAATIADRDGLEAASLSAVAADLGIKTPSLYNHVAGLAGLRREMALHTAGKLTRAFEDAASAATAPDEILRQVARAYRAFVKDHPGIYRTLNPAPRPGEDDQLYAALAAPVAVLQNVLASGGIGEEDAIHFIRALRAMLHGFVDLETNGGFGMPTDIDVSFERGVDAMISGVTGF